MRRKLIPIVFFFITASFLLPLCLSFADEKSNSSEFKEEWTSERYVKYFYNRYSANFDDFGLFYMAPDYGIENFKSPESARESITLATYYSYRAKEGDYKAREIIKAAVSEVKKELSARPANTQSFEDAEALFLMLRALENLPVIFSGKEYNDYLEWIAGYAEQGIKAPDTENRAIISGTHWQYIVDSLNSEGKISAVDKKRYSKMIYDKIFSAVKSNIREEGWYVEGRHDNFTPHYHAVAAYMLMIYSKLSGNKEYADISRRMYENIKRISFDNGMVEASLGHRPSGLGAQFYLMAGFLGKAFGDSEYGAYLHYGFGSRFFSDPTRPNRLEYHPTIEGSRDVFNDDYSFADAAELALSIPSLNSGSFNFSYFISAPEIFPEGSFIQKNSGREIIFAGEKFILGSYGNWARKAGE